MESGFPATQKPAKLFFEDEARFGRIDNYAYTTVCPATGETFSIISPQNDTQAMTVFLKHLSRSFIQYNIAIVLDSAGWHRSKALQIPKNISLIHLPPYSPELNPVEHIWDYIREQKGFNNHSFNSLDDVESQLMAALKEINQENEKIKSLCYFSWFT